MADTTSRDEIPEPPHTPLGACTSGELSRYEAALKRLYKTTSGTKRIQVGLRLIGVEEEWAARSRITPGFAGRTWPLHNSM